MVADGRIDESGGARQEGRLRKSPDEFRDRIHRFPKAELHVHLDGSLRPETLLELSRDTGQTLPVEGVPALERYMEADAGGSLETYLERFEITLSVMQSAGSLERIAYELVEDLAGEGCWYAEIRYSPILNIREGLTVEEAVEASLKGLRRAEEDFDVRTGLIICAIRNMDPSVSVHLADLAIAYKNKGVVGFDLAGAEHDNPPRKHAAAFSLARSRNLPITVHAGEAFGPESIHQALHECGAHRIGHGTRLREDPELLRYVRDFRVPLELCLTSNVQTGAAESLEAHPLREYFNSGLVVSLNTDNRLVSGTTLTEEYWKAHHHLGFTLPELAKLALMSFEGAFLPWPEKQALVQRAEQALAELE